MDQQYNQTIQKEEQCIEDFQQLIESAQTYIDKTLFIKQVIKTQERIIIVHRPPKWGKSINMSMLYYYFGCNVIQGLTKIEQSVFSNKPQFNKFKISQQELSKSAILQKASHPIIFLNFKDIECENMLQFAGTIRSKLQKYAKKQLKDIYDIDYTEQYNLNNYIYDLIAQVAKELQQQYNQKDCLLIIDNYSSPTELMLLNKIKGQEIQSCVNFLQTMCKHFVQSYDLKFRKDNNRKVILAGKMNIWDEIICRKIQQKFCSLKDSYYSDCFGFDENEIKEYLLSNVNLDKQAVFQNLKKWHNGFVLVKKNKKALDDLKLIFHPYTSKRYIQKCIEQNKIVAGSLLLSYNTYEKLFKFINNQSLKDISQIVSFIKKLQKLNSQQYKFSYVYYAYKKVQYQIFKYSIYNWQYSNYCQQMAREQSFLLYLFYYNGILTGTYNSKHEYFCAYIPNQSFLQLLQHCLRIKLQNKQTIKDFTYINIEQLQDVRRKFKVAINDWHFISSLNQFKFNAMTLIRYGLSDEPTHRVYTQQRITNQKNQFDIKKKTSKQKNNKYNTKGILDDCYYPYKNNNKYSFILHQYKLIRDINPATDEINQLSNQIFWQIFTNKYFKWTSNESIIKNQYPEIKINILRGFIFYKITNKNNINNEKSKQYIWQVHAQEIYFNQTQIKSLQCFLNHRIIKEKISKKKKDYKKIGQELLSFTGHINAFQFAQFIKSKTINDLKQYIVKRDIQMEGALYKLKFRPQIIFNNDGTVSILKQGLSQQEASLIRILYRHFGLKEETGNSQQNEQEEQEQFDSDDQ